MSGPAITSSRTVRCPGCGGASEFSAANPDRPFCSERCKMGDFGAWASESYRVGVEPPAEDTEPPPPH
ncbi:DNA gyrase inhibitor YacG [Methylibium sp.]|uniref:DNA gyrase inhibitor YacG n=1 Tax=Methylibium sp. TaxID=2067992 RepID=UPI00286C6079|nr:DNA gyrase inhibitor YacG [Methylibium sp.]